VPRFGAQQTGVDVLASAWPTRPLQDDPEGLSVLLLEYWHYLQNLTTVAGFISLLLQQDFVATFSETLYDAADGTSVGSDAVAGTRRLEFKT
jgi:hypothetical protein